MNREVAYSFKAQWFDTNAQISRFFQIRYFVESHNIDIVNLKTNKLFLKKTSCPDSVTKEDFYLNSKILLYGRNFELIDYMDVFTKEQLGSKRQKSILIIHEQGFSFSGKVIDSICRNDFTISELKMLKLAKSDSYNPKLLHAYHQIVHGARNENCLILAIEFVAQDCVTQLNSLVNSLRSRYESNNNVIFQTSENSAEVESQHSLLFCEPQVQTATFQNATCCVIQPHAIKSNQAGQIIDKIQQADFSITAMEMFNLDRASASEFLEVYDGVVPHFNDSIDQLITGPCIAMELVSYNNKENVVNAFREIAGPWDIGIAKEIRPNSIRAAFGIDRAKHGIHCTDLPEDGVLESEYFFDILSKKR